MILILDWCLKAFLNMLLISIYLWCIKIDGFRRLFLLLLMVSNWWLWIMRFKDWFPLWLAFRLDDHLCLLIFFLLYGCFLCFDYFFSERCLWLSFVWSLVVLWSIRVHKLHQLLCFSPIENWRLRSFSNINYLIQIKPNVRNSRIG